MGSEMCIRDRPKMTEEYAEIIHLADNIVLSTEARDIAHAKSMEHEENAPEALPHVIHAMSWDKARLIFILRYQALV